MRTTLTLIAASTLAALICAPGHCDPAGVTTAASASTAAPAAPTPVDSQTLATLQQDNVDLGNAEKSAQFGTYQAVLMRLTTPDFNFNTADHVSYTRSKFLNGEQYVMSQPQTVTSLTWKCASATNSPVSTAVTAVAVRDEAYSAADLTGSFGTKGLTHQFVSHSDVSEDWVKNASGQWVMDDMTITSMKLTVDGKPWTAADAAAAAAAQQPRQPTYQQTRPQQPNSGRRTRIYGVPTNNSF
jgi:hypothetical protein